MREADGMFLDERPNYLCEKQDQIPELWPPSACNRGVRRRQKRKSPFVVVGWSFEQASRLVRSETSRKSCEGDPPSCASQCVLGM